MQATSISYCSKCLIDFQDGEKVWFVVSDNNCLCSDCERKVNTKVEPRIFLKNLSSARQNPESDTSAITHLALSKVELQRLIEWFDFVKVEGFEVPIDRVILDKLQDGLNRYPGGV